MSADNFQTIYNAINIKYIISPVQWHTSMLYHSQSIVIVLMCSDIYTYIHIFIGNLQVKEIQVETIVDTLCTNMMSDKEQLRDISSIGLKTVIVELPPSATSLAAGISRKITGRLTNAISKQVRIMVLI